jgi:hypothetical protein
MLGRALAWLAAAALVGLVAWLLVAPPAWIETVWLHGPWPRWAERTSRLHTAVALPMTVVVVLGGAALALAAALLRPPRWRRAGVALLAWVALLALTFVPAWGASYRRAPLAHTLGLADDAATVPALLEAYERLAARVHAAAPERALAASADDASFDVAVAAAARCVSEVDAVVSGRSVALPERVTPLPAGTLLRAGYGGISLPWLLEPHVDRGLPPAARLAVATHELAHAAGWAREADTDALALLAGIACDHAWVRYANALAGMQAVRASLLVLVAPNGVERARLDATLAALPAAARADRAALAEAVARWYRPAIAQRVTTVYDAYLRSQGVDAGVADYDASGALVAAALAACGDDATEPWCR